MIIEIKRPPSDSWFTMQYGDFRYLIDMPFGEYQETIYYEYLLGYDVAYGSWATDDPPPGFLRPPPLPPPPPPKY